MGFADSVNRLVKVIADRCGLFDAVREHHHGENAYRCLRITPLHHGRAVGQFYLMNAFSRASIIGEANFSRPRRQPSRRNIIQAWPMKHFVLPSTAQLHCLHRSWRGRRERRYPSGGGRQHPEHRKRLIGVRAQERRHYHRELGKIVWDYCGMYFWRRRAGEGAHLVGTGSGRMCVTEAPRGEINQELERPAPGRLRRS